MERTGTSTLYILYIPLQMQKHRKKPEKLRKKTKKEKDCQKLKKNNNNLKTGYWQ